MSNNIMQEEKKIRSKGMQFVSRMTQMGDYFYLRIPKERNETARKYLESKKYLLVNFNEVEIEN